MILNMRDNEMRAEGKSEGLIEGRKEGRKEGLKEGRKDGLTEGAFLTAWNMAKNGLIPIEKAAEFVGLSVDDFEKQVVLYTNKSDE